MSKVDLFLFILPVALSAIPALAIQADDRTPQAVHQEIRIAIVKLEGSLTCRMGSENNGQPCMIRLQDTRSGRMFTFADPSEALRLFNSGKRYVSVVGMMADDEMTIQIQKISAL